MFPNVKLFRNKNRSLAFWLHPLAWSIIFVFPLYFWLNDYQRNTPFFIRMYFNTLSHVILFYINYVWLIPAFLLKGKRTSYASFLVVWVAALYYGVDTLVNHLNKLMPFDHELESLFRQFMEEHHIQPPSPTMHIYNYVLTSVMVIGFSMGLRLLERHNRNEKQRKEMEREKLNSELAFLKNQISPHFFFNTLNNIYSLMQISVDDAGQTVLKLSKLMRYLLYETESALQPLDKEIEFMQHYIDLMRLRLSSKVQLNVSFPETGNKLQVPPLLFISFIENAFKHGISNLHNSSIEISLQLQHEQVLFSCTNTRFPSETDKTPDSGIGLGNIRKRLQLLYPDKHQLQLNETADYFTVQLQINTSAS